MQSSDAMNSNCCTGSSTCTNGVPSNCDAGCAAVFMPFWQQCQTFTQTNLPELGARRAGGGARGISFTGGVGINMGHRVGR